MLLLWLLAVVPAIAQNVVRQGNISELSVEEMPGDTYGWELYNDATVNFVVVPGTAVADGDAEFVGGYIGPTVNVLWNEPGLYFVKVTARDVSGCTNNVKIIIIEVIHDQITPTFDPIGPYCPGTTIAELPDTSKNGIAGSWSPSIDNTTTTSYTFTPSDGQGATTAILQIEILSLTVPVFPAIGTLCWNSEAPGLPSTSTNGIRGAWSPSAVDTHTAGSATYTFTPRAGQCAASTSLLIETIDAIRITETHVDIDKVISFGSIDLTIEGGTGPGTYSYAWSNGATTEDLSQLPKGKYSVVVTDLNGCQSVLTIGIVSEPGQAPVATRDVFFSGCNIFRGDLIYTDNGSGKDYDPDGDSFFIETAPIVIQHGSLTINPDGSFVYLAEPGFSGDVSFQYRIYDVKQNFSTPATVIIHIVSDMDRDGIADADDPDMDGDGILNDDEGGLTADSDSDGLVNCMDIDADGDGIVDNSEGQSTALYRAPSYLDVNENGMDDAYDVSQFADEIKPVDTDGDGTPDFLEPDTDNDLVFDFIEGHDANLNGKPDHFALGKDSDGDGLDDGYDMVVNDCNILANALGSNASLQDFDGDRISDWRDENDDDDAYLTLYEDLNADGDFSNDDFDYDGFPEYLDHGRDCDLLIPDAFSPNGDGVHDYYQIYCINQYPNAIIYIFDQLGNKIFEKAHYGNLDFWKSPERAWWSGLPEYGRGNSRTEMVSAGTYFYVLDLGNGEVKKSFVFVSY